MQTIQLKKFGTVLISRPAGLEAFNAIRPELNHDTPIQIDFNEVLTVTPSWLDEFLIHLTDYNNGKVELLPTTNASVLASLPILKEARNDFVSATILRAIERMRNPK